MTRFSHSRDARLADLHPNTAGLKHVAHRLPMRIMHAAVYANRFVRPVMINQIGDLIPRDPLRSNRHAVLDTHGLANDADPEGKT